MRENFFVSIKNFLRKRKIPVLPSIIIGLLLVIVLLGGLYYFKGQLIVARVNGQPIWRLTLLRELEKQAGEGVLDSLITETLILQEARKENVVVSESEIDQTLAELRANIEAQGQDFDQVLGAQGISEEELRKQIEIQTMVEKTVGQDIEVSDEEIAEYFETNQDYFPEDFDLEENKEEIRDQISQEKLNEKIQSWLESLRDGAEINYF